MSMSVLLAARPLQRWFLGVALLLVIGLLARDGLARWKDRKP